MIKKKHNTGRKKFATIVHTFEDVALRGDFLTAELQKTGQVAEMFDFTQHGETLLQFPFATTGIALCNLREKQE